MTESQTDFRSGDMPNTPTVTATPATIAKLVAPRPFFIAKPVVEDSSGANVGVDEGA